MDLPGMDLWKKNGGISWDWTGIFLIKDNIALNLAANFMI